MPSTHRTEKLEGLIKEELSKIVDRELDLPGGALITLTRIVLSSDGHYANVYLSILSDTPDAVLNMLKKNIYEIQQALNKKLPIRPVPRIRFALDEQEFRREKVEKTLSHLKRKGEL